MAFSKKQHFKNNLKALEAAFSPLEPTAEQQAALSGYSGFGGLKCVLYPAATDADIAH